jgi:hypothetical protein
MKYEITLRWEYNTTWDSTVGKININYIIK